VTWLSSSCHGMAACVAVGVVASARCQARQDSGAGLAVGAWGQGGAAPAACPSDAAAGSRCQSTHVLQDGLNWQVAHTAFQRYHAVVHTAFHCICVAHSGRGAQGGRLDLAELRSSLPPSLP
jgi:hypothetical protein